MQGDGAPGQAADEVVAERGDTPSTVWSWGKRGARKTNKLITSEDSVLHFEIATINHARAAGSCRKPHRILGEGGVSQSHEATDVAKAPTGYSRAILGKGGVRDGHGPVNILKAATAGRDRRAVADESGVGNGHRTAEEIEEATTTKFQRASTVVVERTMADRRSPGVENAPTAPPKENPCRISGQDAVDEGQRTVIVNASASQAGPVPGEGQVDEGQHAGISDTPAVAWTICAAQGESLESEGTGRRDAQDAETGGVGIPLNDGGLRPRSTDGHYTGNDRQAATSKRPIVDCSERICASLKIDRILLTVRICGVDRRNQACDVARSDVKNSGIARNR